MGGVIASGSTLAVMVSRVNWRNEAELAKQSAVNVHNIDDEQEEKVAVV